MVTAAILGVAALAATANSGKVNHGCPRGAPEELQWDADEIRGLGYSRAKRTVKRHECTMRVAKLGPAMLPVTDDFVPNRVNVWINGEGRVRKVLSIG